MLTHLGYGQESIERSKNLQHPYLKIGSKKRPITLVPDYFYRGYQPFQGVNQLEHRVRFAVTLGNKWKEVSLNNRYQIEYRFRHFQKNSTRLKSRLRFEYPFKQNQFLFLLFTKFNNLIGLFFNASRLFRFCHILNS